MASLFKRSRSPFWWGAFTVGGIRKQESTKTTDKAEALKIVATWEKAAGFTTDDIQSPKQARRVIQKLMVPHLDKDGGRMTCRDYMDRWLHAKKGTVRDSSYASYKCALGRFLTHLGPAAERDINSLSEDQLVEWRNAEAGRIKIKTVNHRMKLVGLVIKAAVRAGYMQVNESANVEPLKQQNTVNGVRVKTKVRRPFTDAEITRLESVMDDEWKTITLMGYFTGQRLGDILTFEWSDISFAKKSLHLITRKTGRKMWLPVADELLERLAAWKAQLPERSQFVFPTQAAIVHSAGAVAKSSNRFAHWLWKAGLRTHSPYGRSRPQQRRKAARLAAGLSARENDERKPQELTFHCLRHTARTRMALADVPKAVIDAFIGHDGDSGDDYTTVGEDALRDAALALAAGRTGKVVRFKAGRFAAVQEDGEHAASA